MDTIEERKLEMQKMIDFSNLESYTENNRIEVKKAQGTLPNSIWETYSSFANTLGGIILLGVAETKNKSLVPIGLSDPEKLIKDFWNIINNQNKININILTSSDVFIQEINGKSIVVINVPRAQRFYKPVYINGNPVSGTYRRNGEGDYHVNNEELKEMYREANVKAQDIIIIEAMDISVLCSDSINSYRQRMKLSRPGHIWEGLSDEVFLMKLGAAGIGADGKIHPTAAGLLMFGYESDIVREFPNYFLDYREDYDNSTRWTDRIQSSSGDWSGNVYDFYFRVYNKLQQDIKVPFKLEGNMRIDDTPVHMAIREALANCIINADYYGRQGLVVIKTKDSILLSNPGDFRIELDAAKSGGYSDPRNSTLMKMFNLIDIGERAGSGIPSIYYIWEKQGLNEPYFRQSFEPNRITLVLPITKDDDKKSAIKIGDKKSAIKSAKIDRIIEYLTDHAEAKASELAEYSGLKASRVRDYLKFLVEEGTVTAEGSNRNRIYKLKS